MNLSRMNGIRTGVLIAAMCASVGTASAFDTGPHFDITEDVLKSEGFNRNAISTVKCGNFFVDFYEFIGNKMIQKALDGDCSAKVAAVMKLGDDQHFDELQSTTEVAHKWDAMLESTKATAEAKAKSGDILGLMCLLGMSLHNVQDFYAHSNWVEDSPSGPGIGKGALAKYGDHPTWLSVDRADREKLDVYTRKDTIKRSHGDWDTPLPAMNKDWIGRPKHMDAYICAYFASRQWVRLFQSWVNDPAVWTKMQGFAKSSFDPGRDLDYCTKISFYGGHWNGNGGPTGLDALTSKTAATSPDLLVGAVLNFMGGRCITKKPSALRSEAERLLLSWGKMPYHGPVDPTLPSAAPENLQFVKLQVHKVEGVHADDGFAGGQMDWYSEASIAGQDFMSCLIDEHNNFDFKPPYAPWTMIKAMPATKNTVGMYFTLKELDYDDDDTVDVNPKSGSYGLLVNYATASGTFTGDVSGSAKTPITVEGKGDCDCARISMSVDRMLASCLK